VEATVGSGDEFVGVMTETVEFRSDDTTQRLDTHALSLFSISLCEYVSES
jgi:hypothetical protein